MLEIASLLFILAAVLVLPFLVKKIEEHLESFLCIAGVSAVTLSSQWSWALVSEALVQPIRICVTVLIAGLLFLVVHSPIRRLVKFLDSELGPRIFAFIVVVVLGLLSSVLTAIVAALILVEIVSILRYDRQSELRLIVITCFSIGIGAALTPIGEPLSTILIAKLQGAPWNANFWFCLHLLGVYILPGIFAFGILAAVMVSGTSNDSDRFSETGEENWKEVIIRGCKTYLFILALIFLGTGFKPLIDKYITQVPAAALYWINTISAVLDNATLTAAEIGPSMSKTQITSAILGLLLAGGMLIPGNIPNIVAANKLKIRSKEWARLGLPIGLCTMGIYFILLSAQTFMHL